MGASAKRKKEKQKDFQKPKLKVGKAKAKPDNFTNTSFKSKAITLATQSLHTSAPSTSYLFTHHLSLLTHHNASTRKESLSYLKTHLPTALSTTTSNPNAISSLPTTSSLISSLLPLILDPAASVRAQLLTLLSHLPQTHIALHTRKILLFVNSAMTHISSEIRADSPKFLDWLVGACGEDVFSAGGWGVCLRGLCGCLGFAGAGGSGAGGKASSIVLPKVQDVKIALPHLSVLTKVLEAGLVGRVDVEGQEDGRRRRPDGLHVSYEAHKLPSRSNAYASLGLFEPLGAVSKDGVLQEAEPEDRVSRMRYLTGGGSGRAVFDSLTAGLGRLKKDGGEVGRAAGKALAVLDAASKEDLVE
ncbi:hypothetical protein L873DRAFT_1694498 [Choiromyces venosus 120613-1]|uniref:Pre-rRNA-processing protein n=1 Tax=Choiromyces venosus 120613-1 TaxID=1336337 RepID=A0A3N4JDS6_9PEZI|nr:hypothetical protein L873DRAFT_1694498 [Choiromyces venosus 120613-1]